MDLRAYYRTVRETESHITGQYAVLVSLATPDGGKAGVLTEVARYEAAKQVTEGRARLATQSEAKAFYAAQHDAKVAADQALAASRLQFVVVPANTSQSGSKE
jgi:hypothetical protein